DVTAVVDQADVVGEVVVVGPGDGRAVGHGDGGGLEPIRLREVHLGGRDRFRVAGRRAGRQRQRGAQGQADDVGGPEMPPHAGPSSVRSRAVIPRVAATKTSKKASRSRTSAMVWANRMTVQSR